ncbi:hypothetical protein GGE07_005987 [Sinorhizobium terangae]|uniref:Apple domain-containing protein n=2 Tax=Sinorhizobium terangae TaxID=110322 RepID=A0A6N7LK57_SINTE|nr:hypothetical protein [Sinorhizobium terangae]MQX18182.1 hypothetical protein [Sinorhizobium terangae]
MFKVVFLDWTNIVRTVVAAVITVVSAQTLSAQEAGNAGELLDYPGTFLNGLVTAEVLMTPDKCRKLCTDRSGCVGFDHSSSTNQCRLFGGIASAREDTASTAGTRYPITGYREPTPAARPPRTFDHYANYDLFGFDLDQAAATSLTECEDYCRGNEECRAFTFNEWNQKCFLKSGTAELRLEPRATTGVLAGTAHPGYRNASVVMEYYRDYVISGSQIGNSRVVNSRDQCESMCWDREQCIAFSFSRRQRECRLFDHADNRFPRGGMESGAKIQPRP